MKVSFYNGDEGKTGEQFEYICYRDREGDFSYGTKHYYRVQAYVEESDIISLYSKALLVRASLPQPEILSITGPHKDGGTCYKQGEIVFGIPQNMDIDDVKYFEIYRSTKKDSKYKRIKKVKVDFRPAEVVSSPDGNMVLKYEPVTYKKFPPEVPYYYKVRAVGRVKNVKGAFSEWVEHTTHFEPVTDVEAETVNQKSLRVSWKSERCATKYEVWRYGPFSTSPLNAEEVHRVGRKRIATVANKPNDNGIMSYKDSKSLSGMSWYCYEIIPVNGKKKGAPSTQLAGACTRVMGPTKVSADGRSFTQIDVSWNASYNPTSYIVQRTTTAPNGQLKEWTTLATLKADSTGFKNRKYSDKKSSSNPLEVGVKYHYRVLSTIKVKGREERSDESLAVVAIGYLRPGAPKSTAIAVLVDANKSWAGNSVSWKKPDADHIKEYVLERRTSTKDAWKEVTRVLENGTSIYKYRFTNDDSRGVHYYYRVYAIYNDGKVVLDGRPAEVNILMPSKISLESEAATLKVGQTYKVKIGSFTPEGTTFKDIVFTNSNTGVIQSTSSGSENGRAYVIFKAKKKGTATVTAKPKYYTGSSTNLVKKCVIKVE